MNFTPFPTIETENLVLRKMDENDRYDLFEMRKDPRMNEYTDSKVDEHISETEAYIEKMNAGVEENKWIIWAIEHKLSKKVIGSISIWNINNKQKSGELGYGITPNFQGKGYMKEALQSIAQYGLNVMNLKELFAYTEANNKPSICLLEKCGFTEVGKVEEAGYFSSKIYHMIIYKLK
ncbi:GNAT family N-acetyltransferase [Psychrobacillus sp.]|uniref:GNAT family N-acetyltransferase n=1 Tax=Psychrobacillus sp. TaxID=1871623 RepID=UPI0028BEFD0F|nr:GNAT family N-acetyltransferase [Psychrobacillus sp.]